MKIAVLDMDNLNNPHWGGGQARSTLEIFSRFSKKHQITVYCSKYPGWKNYTYKGISYKHIGIGSNFPILNNLAYLCVLPFVVKNLTADIILEDFTAPFATHITPLITDIPVVGRTSFFNSTELSQKYKLPFHAITTLGSKLYKEVITHSPEIAKKVKTFNTKINTHTIPLGVDENFFKLKKADHNYVLFLGRIDIQHKGLDLLIRSWKKISESYPDLELIIAGTGSEHDVKTLQQMISINKLTASVRYIGKVEGDKRDSILQNCSFVVCPSRYETFGLSALESLASGKPVVCYNVPGFSWIDDSVSRKAAKITAEDLAVEIDHLLKNPENKKSLTNKARRFAKQFSWDHISKEYQQLLETIQLRKVESYA